MRLRRAARNGVDVAVLAAAWGLAYLLRFEFAPPGWATEQLWVLLPVVVAGGLALLHLSGAHRESWRYIGLYQCLEVVRATTFGALLLGVAWTVYRVAPDLPGAAHGAVPRSIIVIHLVLATVGLVGVRVLRRLQVEQRELRGRPRPAQHRRVLLIGAGRAGLLVARELHARPELGLEALGFLDDDPTKQGRALEGIPVLGGTDELARCVRELRPDEAVITIASASAGTVRRLKARCDEVGLPTKIIPGIYEIVGGRVNLSRLQPVQLEDVLGRDPVELDVSSIEDVVAGEVVLVTGAGGSIGAELCRQLARFRPGRLVLVDQAENPLWQVHRELTADAPHVEVAPAVADVVDAARVDELLRRHRPAVVFHAAAHKHVPIMEHNAAEAVKNNVGGTRTVVDAAARHDVGRFVLVSTDKAVNPASVMGATKRLAERYVQHVAAATGRAYVSVRFGNVLGSSGSVVPVFREQIHDGGPVTVTHPEARRYFMTVPEAAQLVIQAAAIGERGEILVLDMGEPVRIVDLAEELIRLSGLTPGEDVAIEFTGLRPGEKLCEELDLVDERAARTDHPKILVGQAASDGWRDPDGDLRGLLAAAGSADPDTVRAHLALLVPELGGVHADVHADGHAHSNGERARRSADRDGDAPATPARSASSTPGRPASG